MSNLDANGIDPDDLSITCGELQEAAEAGNFSAEECAELMDDIDIFVACGCVADPVYEDSKKERPGNGPARAHSPSSGTVACSICGEGYAVSNPDTNGIDPDDLSITCGEVQDAAEAGDFTAEECTELMGNTDIFDACGCVADPVYEDSKKERPGNGPARAHSPTSGTVVCSICGDGYVVSNTDSAGIDPTDASITCGEMQKAAKEGTYSAEECAELVNDDAIFFICGCARDPLDEDGEIELGDSPLPDGTPSSEVSSCSICGEGYVVTKPNANGIYPEDSSKTCGHVQKEAEGGMLTSVECAKLMKDVDVFKRCGCVPDPDSGHIPSPPTKKGDSPSSDDVSHEKENLGGCEFSVSVQCVPPRDSGHKTCADYVVPELSDCVSTPRELHFKFGGGRCDAYQAPQGANQYLCQDFDGGAAVANDESNFIEVLRPRRMGAPYYEGSVKIGDTLIIAGIEGERDPLDEEVLILIYKDATKTTLLQMMVFHTQCKEDLTLGDPYGSLELMTFSNEDSSLSMYKNVTYEVTITNIGAADLHIQHAVTILDQVSSDVLGDGEELVLRASGQEALTLVQEFTIDITQPRVISGSATVMGYDHQMNTCVAFGETETVIPEYNRVS